MLRKLGVAGFLLVATGACAEASAWLPDWLPGSLPRGGAGGGYAAPEIDGAAGISALALLVAVGVVAFNRFKK